MKLLRRAVLALAVLALAACDSSDGSLPTADELQGVWVNVDQGTVRAFDFAATARTYELYVYQDGSSPIVNQSGSYEVASGRLVTHVNASVDPAIVGQSFGNDILGFTGSKLTLESGTASNGRRVFTRADALP
ncbi:MAG: hypothetical protein IT385_09850 [Deltaproteobacteria bacterium]|nr:hypothetical protein [Deltaproteobacteria bacterium]